MFCITPTGRATIEALQLNREGLVNLRRVLYAMGEHPSKENVQEMIPSASSAPEGRQDLKEDSMKKENERGEIVEKQFLI